MHKPSIRPTLTNAHKQKKTQEGLEIHGNHMHKCMDILCRMRWCMAMHEDDVIMEHRSYFFVMEESGQSLTPHTSQTSFPHIWVP